MAQAGGVSDAAVTPRRARTRARLLAAAREVIAAEGAGGATVERICERAGFTRGAFYSNYSSLPELVNDLMVEIGSARLAAFSAGIPLQDPDPADPRGSLAAALRLLVDLQPTTVDDVVLLTELRLFAIRHPYSARSSLFQDVNEEMLTLIRSVLDRLGLQLRISITLACSLLHAYFDHVTVLSHVCGTGDPSETLVEGLMEVLSVIAEPKPARP